MGMSSLATFVAPPPGNDNDATRDGVLLCVGQRRNVTLSRSEARSARAGALAGQEHVAGLAQVGHRRDRAAEAEAA